MSAAATTLSAMVVEGRDRTRTQASDAAAQRAAARQERVAAGLDDLDRWLSDQVRNGLAGWERAGYGPLDQVASRLVDAQAPGAAGMVRSIASEIGREDWPSRVLLALAGLHLLAKAHARLSVLPEDLAATVRSRVGYTVGKESVLAGPPVSDRWCAVGSVDSVEYYLQTRRVWLWGGRTQRWALWLAFAPPGRALDGSVAPGRTYVGDLHFYPGSGQFRALPGEIQEIEEVQVPPALDLAAAAFRFAALVAEDPWADRMPVVLTGTPVEPGQTSGPWRFRDREGYACDLLGLEDDPWPLVAHAAAGPVNLLGEYGPAGLRPLAIMPDVRGRPFTPRLTP